MGHRVTVTVPPLRVERADVTFEVRDDDTDAKIGELAVSRGSVVWFPVNKHYGYRMAWSKLEQMMEDNAVKFEKR